MRLPRMGWHRASAATVQVEVQAHPHKASYAEQFFSSPTDYEPNVRGSAACQADRLGRSSTLSLRTVWSPVRLIKD